VIFNYKQYQVEYLQFGHGKKILLAFHGFGQDATIFYNIEAAIAPYFTIYSFNLFHHGKSCFPEGLSPDAPMSMEFNKEWLEAFLTEHQIESFSLLGYSLGGRVALSYLHLFPERIESLILFAPDGIKKSFWYHFATQNHRGKKLFRRMITRPDLFFRIVKYLRMMRLIPQPMEKFLHAQFGKEELRKLIFHVWNSYSRIETPIRITKRILTEQNIPTLVFTGMYDPVLNKEIGQILLKGLESKVKWISLPSGHHLLKPTLCEEIHREVYQHIIMSESEVN
jgi:pimeloyl-ACP methyl ester carboxylesterase